MVLFGSGIRLVEAPEGFHRGADTTYPPVVRAGYTRAASLQGLRGAQSDVFEFECRWSQWRPEFGSSVALLPRKKGGSFSRPPSTSESGWRFRPLKTDVFGLRRGLSLWTEAHPQRDPDGLLVIEHESERVVTLGLEADIDEPEEDPCHGFSPALWATYVRLPAERHHSRRRRRSGSA